MNVKHIAIPFMVAIADQSLKALVRQYPVGHVFYRLNGIVEFTHASNVGAAFSLFSGQTLFLLVVSAGLLSGIVVFAFFSMRLTKPAKTAVLFLLGGGVGNLIDRVFFSCVTDYIRLMFIRFPIFNLADIAITSSVACLIWLSLNDRLEEETKEIHGTNN